MCSNRCFLCGFLLRFSCKWTAFQCGSIDSKSSLNPLLILSQDTEQRFFNLNGLDKVNKTRLIKKIRHLKSEHKLSAKTALGTSAVPTDPQCVSAVVFRSV